jgi:hypothetical protein
MDMKLFPTCHSERQRGICFFFTLEADSSSLRSSESQGGMIFEGATMHRSIALNGPMAATTGNHQRVKALTDWDPD